MTDVPSPSRSETGRLGWLRVIDTISIVLAVLAALITASLMINVIADVLGRGLFNRPLPGTIDLTQYAWMPSLISLALGYALLRGEHIRVSLLTGPIGPRAQRVIEVIGMASTLVVVTFFIWFGVEKAFDSARTSEHAVGAPWLTIWPFRVVLVVGMIGLLLQALAQLIRAVTVHDFVPADEDETIALLEQESSVLDDLDLGEPGERAGALR